MQWRVGESGPAMEAMEFMPVEVMKEQGGRIVKVPAMSGFSGLRPARGMPGPSWPVPQVRLASRDPCASFASNRSFQFP